MLWTNEEEGDPYSETGWMVLPEFQGQGLAKAAVRLLLERARDDGRWGLVHAYPGVTNGPSNGICRDSGLHLGGGGPAGDFRRAPAARQPLAHRPSDRPRHQPMTEGASRSLLVTGGLGTGKSTVAVEIGFILEDAGLPNAIIDVDWLGWTGPDVVDHTELLRDNLAAVTARMQRSGIRWFVLAWSISGPPDVAWIAEAVPDHDLTVVALDCDRETAVRRVRERGVGATTEHDHGAGRGAGRRRRIRQATRRQRRSPRACDRARRPARSGLALWLTRPFSWVRRSGAGPDLRNRSFADNAERPGPP